MVNNLFTKMLHKKYFIFFVYLALYGFLFIPLIKGWGNYWDWNIPYFSDHLKNLSNNFSWSDINFGVPLGFISSLYLTHLFSLTHYLKIQPEILLYIIVIIPATISSYFTFLLTKRFSNGYLAFILGVAVILNPAYFYKMLAGHTVYFFSFSIFVYLLYYLFTFFQKNIRSAIILGLLFAFCGAQPQFFIFSAVTLLVYFIIYREKFSPKYLFLTAVIVLSINLPLLLNFFNGSASVSSLAGVAKADAFYELSHGNFIYVFCLLFTKATLIQYFYSKILLFFFLGLSAIVLYSIIIGKKNKDYYFTVLCSLFFVVGATGLPNYLGFFPFNYLSSIVREVGHYAPVVVLFMLLLVSYSFTRQIKIFKILTYIYLAIFLIVNIHIFWGYVSLPSPDFSHVRDEFSKYEIQNNSDLSTYRILTYPFFGQYSFNDVEKKYVGDTPSGSLLNNSGWDNYTNNSGKENINNSLTISSFEDSLQLEFTKNHDLTKLENLGIKYIYDYSNIYESNIERYIPATLYDNNLSLIKNQNLIKDLSKQFPDRLKKISEDVYQLTQAKPRMYLESPGDSKLLFEKIDPTLYKVTIKNLKTIAKFDFLNSYNSQWKILPASSSIDNCKIINMPETTNVIECEKNISMNILSTISLAKTNPVFEASHQKTDDGMNQWEIDPSAVNADVSFYIFFRPQSFFLIAMIISASTIILSFAILLFCAALVQIDPVHIARLE